MLAPLPSGLVRCRSLDGLPDQSHPPCGSQARRENHCQGISKYSLQDIFFVNEVIATLEKFSSLLPVFLLKGGFEKVVAVFRRVSLQSGTGIPWSL